MSNIQTDLSEDALVNAIRGNLSGFFRFLTRKLPTSDRFENDKFARWYTPLSHPWFNGFVCSVTPSQADDDFIREMYNGADEMIRMKIRQYDEEHA